MKKTAYRDLHDGLLAEMPEGASHDIESCPLCSGGLEEETASIEIDEGGAVTTYTQEDLDAAITQAVSEATAPLAAKIAEFETAQEEDTVKAKITEAVAPLQQQVSELQSQLDTAVLEGQTAKDELAAVVAYLEDVNRQAEELAAFTARLEERVVQVKEVANFSDDYVAANQDRWARLDDELFAALIEDWKQVASKSPKPKAEEKVPAVTAMVASSEATTATDAISPVKEMFHYILTGLDPRQL